MRLTVLGHASVLLESATAGVLIDPIFDEVFASDTLRQQPPRTLDIAALVARTTLLVVTHIHLDHFHPPTLAHFPRDLPIVVPPHADLVRAVQGLGFSQVITLAAWQTYLHADVSLLATPSAFEIDEFGLLCSVGADRYWHMSDAVIEAEVGVRLREVAGAPSLVSVKFQPLRTLIAYQRGLASAMLDRDELCGSLEAACRSAPACVFPYYSGFVFHGVHAWANRHLSPYRAADIAALLRRRLPADTRVVTVAPGDVFELTGRSVLHREAASTVVRAEPALAVPGWEPIDASTLPGLDSLHARVGLTVSLERLLRTEVLPWVQAHLDARSGAFDAYHDYGAVWQCAVHLGAGERLHHAIDFRAPQARLHVHRTHPGASVFSHVSGGLLHGVLRGTLGAEVFWMAGGYRIYENILHLSADGICPPAEDTWALYDRLPDPLVHFLRRQGPMRPPP